MVLSERLKVPQERLRSRSFSRRMSKVIATPALESFHSITRQKGNEQMVYDELEMLQRMKHPHIVKFEDWFESRVSLIWSGVEGYDSSHAFRTNITSSHSWLLEENCSTVSASKEDSQRRMHRRLF